MCFSGGAPSPKLPDAPVTTPDPAVVASLDADRKRRQANGFNSTIMTSSTVAAPQTALKTLLGS